MERLQGKIKEASKTITPDASAEFFKRQEKELAVFDSEADKLITFVGDASQITKADVQAICSTSHTVTLWHSAEALVWQGIKPGLSEWDSANFHPLCSLIRSELRTGYKLRSLLDAGCRPQDLTSYFPGVWPSTLQKKREQAEKKEAHYFKNGLLALFQVELLSKNGIAATDLLFTSFCARLWGN